MSDEAERARMIRAADNYERLKDSPAIKPWVEMGGLPSRSDTGMDEATHQKLIDAIKYGQSKNKSNFETDIMEGLGADKSIERGDTYYRMRE